jgi:hypothetical protein
MTIQAPGYQATTQETSRVFTRNKLEFFYFGFFYDETKTQPVQSLDPQTYPSYQILSPNGEMFAQGVATIGASPGYWKVGWVVPPTAELTNVNRRYRFQCVMVDRESRQFEVSFEFDVVESAIKAQEPKPEQYLAFVGDPVRIMFENTVRPDFLRVVVTPREQDTIIVQQASLTYPIPVTPSPTDLIEVQQGTGYTYYFDVSSFDTIGEYAAKWVVRDTALSPIDSEFQPITIISTNMMFMARSLRMLIDKLQKKLGIVFAYNNETLVEYLRMGNQVINAYWPPTSVTLEQATASNSSTKPLEAFIVLAAAWWGLGAQSALYSETNLDFSGQTTTLGYNPAGEIESLRGTFKEVLDNQVSNTKKNLMRWASSVGSVATRPYRYRTNQVFPISSGTGQEILETMVTLGILD